MTTDLQYDLMSLCGRVDPRVIRFLEQNAHPLDPSYLEHASQFHGGVPGKAYFDSARGKTYRVGRFLTLVDDESELSPPPPRPSWQSPQRDARADWSVLTLIEQEGPTCRYLFDGEHLLPLAALYRGEHHPDGWSLTDADCDLVCFDYRAVGRPRVVVWLANEARQEYMRWEAVSDYDNEPVQYEDFTEPVAEDFDAFLRLLREEP